MLGSFWIDEVVVCGLMPSGGCGVVASGDFFGDIISYENYFLRN